MPASIATHRSRNKPIELVFKPQHDSVLRMSSSPITVPVPSDALVQRAVRLTYAQMMLNAVFGASTGGMFLIGFALQLGADNLLLGWLSSIPPLFVVVQFVCAYLIERGWSRKRLTVWFSFITPLCWCGIAALPVLADRLSAVQRIGLLVSVIALVTVAGQFVGNARGSWVGDLIPEQRRGRFFGNCTLFAGIIGALFAVGEGRFLDFIQSHGLYAFTALFFFGALFGLGAAVLNLPQPDCPLPQRTHRPHFFSVLREGLRNRPLCILAVAHAILAMSSIAGPFYSAYCLRDLGMSYFGLGCLNAISTATMLLVSPFAGRWVDRFGARPFVILGLLILAPTGLVWMFIPPGRADLAYWLMPFGNGVAGIGSGLIGVAFTALLYKLTRSETRAVHFAAYGVVVTLAGAPMPLLGGWMISHLQTAGFAVDLRLVFYLWVGFVLLSALVAKFITEPGSSSTRRLVFSSFPAWIGSLPAWFLTRPQQVITGGKIIPKTGDGSPDT